MINGLLESWGRLLLDDLYYYLYQEYYIILNNLLDFNIFTEVLLSCPNAIL